VFSTGVGAVVLYSDGEPNAKLEGNDETLGVGKLKAVWEFGSRVPDLI